MQQPLLDDLKQTLLMVDKTNVTKLEDIPLSKIGSSFSLNLKHAESKTDYQNSCGTVAEIKLNATSKEFTSVPELLEDKGDSDNESQPLFESDPLTALYSFLNSMDIDRHDILQAGISESHLLRLHQKETGWFSFLQWCSIDHILEKNLQWLLLNSKDLNESISGLGLKRLRPHGRSILLKSTWGLMKAYGARGFAKGIETSLSKSVHYFIYAMLAYRLINLMISSQSNFEEFQGLFQNSNQKGIDSLVIALAQLEAKWLRLILASPILIGALQSMMSFWSAREVNSEKLHEIIDKVTAHLGKSSSICRDTIKEKLSILPAVRALSSKVQRLEQLMRWDGRLTVKDRRKSFESIRRAGKELHQLAQLSALESLAKIAHGVGLKDLPRLYTSGYSKADVLEILYAKITAFKELEQLSKTSVQTWKAKFTSTPRRLYAAYLLWWLGLSTSVWKQRIPFSIFIATKLTIEIFFLQLIAESILEAIRCPDKPGFKFGDGYLPWAADYTADCFTARIKLFRGLDVNESVEALVTEIPQYHLIELTTLNLINKYLTAEEAAQIIQAVVRQGASLQKLYLNSNQINTLNEGVFSGINQLTTLDLSWNQISVINEGVFNGLIQLTGLYLKGNQITALNKGALDGLSQLTTLDLSFSRISVLNKGGFSGSSLTYLDLHSNQISVLNEGVFDGLSQLTYLDLSVNQIGVINEGVFNGLCQLTTLDLRWNQINVLNEVMLSGLSQLATLNLNNNQISVLNEGVFNGLDQLKILDLSTNRLDTSTLSILPFLPMTLTDLDISVNQISYLPPNFSTLLPAGLKRLSVGGNPFIPSVLTLEFTQYFPFRLTTLGLRASHIMNITEGSFLNFSALTALDLSWNQINVLNEGMFSGLNQLTILYLGSNQISVLNKGMFSGLSQLVILDLDSNQISVLNEGMFSRLSQLIGLYLYGNQISSINEGAFSGLSRLTYLNLWSNQISAINEGTFSGLSQLVILDLDSNQISILNHGVFSRLSQLTYLYLYGNQISAINEGMFSGLSQLVTLDLSRNQINVLNESGFSGLIQLTDLYLYGNQIGALSKGAFSGLSRLTDLNLWSNQISAINEGVFSGLSQLITLDLDSNRLNDTAIQNLTRNFPYQLHGLSVSNNQIGDVGALALAKILPCTNLTSIYFEGNPVNDTNLIIATQQRTLQKVCEDQRCHANLPASQSCSVTQAGTGFSKMVWGTGSSIEVFDEDGFADMKSSMDGYSYGSSAPHSFTNSNLPALPTPDSLNKDSLAPAGAMIAGVVGFGLLLYKNATIVKTVVNTSCQLLQNCFYKTCDGLKTVSNFYSFHSSFKTATKTVIATGSPPAIAHTQKYCRF